MRNIFIASLPHFKQKAQQVAGGQLRSLVPRSLRATARRSQKE